VRRAKDISQKIRAYYHALASDSHHRYRSWEHCYAFFREIGAAGISQHREHAALQLGFYLASWGMYRGSGFLLRRTYTVHLGVIDCLTSPDFALLWKTDVGARRGNTAITTKILAAAEAVRKAYLPERATDTLVTKVLLGTLGCLPACDRYFIEGAKEQGLNFSSLNRDFVDRVLHFASHHVQDLRSEQLRIERASGVTYPIMKLVDMYFWQRGYERSK
jgi:hypothetical protein